MKTRQIIPNEKSRDEYKRMAGIDKRSLPPSVPDSQRTKEKPKPVDLDFIMLAAII